MRAESLTAHAQPPSCYHSPTSSASLPAFPCLPHPVKEISLRALLPRLRAFHFEQMSRRGATSRGQQRPHGVASWGGTLWPPSGVDPEVLLHGSPLQPCVPDVEVAGRPLFSVVHHLKRLVQVGSGVLRRFG